MRRSEYYVEKQLGSVFLVRRIATVTKIAQLATTITAAILDRSWKVSCLHERVATRKKQDAHISDRKRVNANYY